jgi:hypothetical protein
MLTIPMFGALLLLAGIVYMAGAAIYRGRMSDPHIDPREDAPTLEPRHRGLRFLGWKANWPGLLMIVIGGIMLLLPASE